MRVLTIIMLLFVFGMYCEVTFADNLDQEKIRDCGEWVNCNYNPPNFDGTCCRICFFEDLGYRDWYCATHTRDIGFTDEERANLRGKFLYDGVNRDVRELLIMELDVVEGE